MGERRKYTDELKSEALKMVVEQGMSQQEVADLLGIPKGTIGNWVVKAKDGMSQIASGTPSVSDVMAENRRLRKELAEAQMEKDIPKKSSRVLCQGVAARYAFMMKQRHRYPVDLMAKILSVSRSGYYRWSSRKPTRRERSDAQLKPLIRQAHIKGRRSAGPTKIQQDLREKGFHVGRDRIIRLRREMGLRCIQKKKFKATTNSKHSFPVAPNLLDQNFKVNSPGTVYGADITYIRTGEGWLYLAGVKDFCTKEIVGYAMGKRMTKELVVEAFNKSLKYRKPEAGCIYHSDRGSQYCSRLYRRLIEGQGYRISMSRKGNCFDNAPTESFWGALKQEFVYHYRFRTREQARNGIQEWIEVFYNRIRRHSAIGNIPPAIWADRFTSERRAA